MYEELVKALRICGDSVDAIDECCYEDCIFHERPINPLCMQDLCNKAADAVEELSREVDIDNAAMTAMDSAMPRWIPVAERLPEDGDNVIVCTKSGNVGEAKYQAALGYDLNYPEIWFLLNDYGNQYQTEEIIAWMPLPEQPKEKI